MSAVNLAVSSAPEEERELYRLFFEYGTKGYPKNGDATGWWNEKIFGYINAPPPANYDTYQKGAFRRERIRKALIKVSNMINKEKAKEFHDFETGYSRGEERGIDMQGEGRRRIRRTSRYGGGLIKF